MISESNVIAIVKYYIVKLLERSEQQNDNKFVSITTENFHLNKVLFSNISTKTTPKEHSEKLNAEADFSRVCDCIPNDNDKLDPSAFTFSLLKKYREILNRCLLEDDRLTDEENAERTIAIEMLYHDYEDNILSEVYKKYIQLKDELFSLQDQLLADKAAIESIEEKERENWDQGIKILLDKINLVEVKLLIEGKKTKIESSIQTLENIHKKNPAILVDSLKQKASKLEEIHELTPGSTPYLPVQPSPAFEDIKTWQQVTIPKKEIMKIIKKLQLSGASLNVQNLTQIDFNWSSVYLARNWFSFTFFESNYWTMPDDIIISLGKRPNDGILQTYVNRIVISNNISYKTKESNKKIRNVKQPIVERATMMPIFNIVAMAKPMQKPKFTQKSRQNKKQPKIASTQRVYNAAIMSASGVLTSRKQNLFIATKPTPQKIILKKAASQKFSIQQLSTSNQIVATKIMAISKKQAIKQDKKNLQSYLDYRKVNLIIPSSQSNINAKTYKIDEVSENPLVLAFICKRIPLCP